MRTKIRQLPVIPQNPLPPLYASWLDGVLDGPIPNETDATCNNCAMLPEDGLAETDSNQFFNPRTKCCTYLPELHNFLAGRILTDEDAASASGRETVEARLQAGVGVTPLSIGTTAVYSLLYNNTTDVFGRAGSMRCPHYIDEDGGRCGVWKHREAICVTWFCKYARGTTGKNFWGTMLRFLLYIEKNISLWCVTQLDVGTDALNILLEIFKNPENTKPTAHEIEGKRDEKPYRAKWGNWFGREKEFYKRCALLANDLKWRDIENICGPELKIYTKLLQEAYQKLVSNEIPQRLMVGSFRLGSMEQNAFSVTTYSGYDTLRLSKPIINILPYFDGRPVAEVLDEITEKEKVRVSTDLMRKLVDFGMLVEV